MKNLILLMVLFLALAPGYAQEQMTPETEVTIQYDDHAATMTMAEFQQQMQNYVTDNNGYKADDGSTVIPMPAEDQEYLRQQAELMKQTAVDYQPGKQSRSDERNVGMSYNEQWGIEDTFSAYVDTAALFSGDESCRKFDAHFHTGAYIMTYQLEVFGVGCNMQNAEGQPAQAETYCRVFGAEYTWSGTLEFSWSMDGEYSASTVIVIAGIPVTVTGVVGGEIGFHAFLSVVEGGVQGNLTPNLVLWGKAEAAVSVGFARVGVRGEIVFLNDNLPITGSVRLKPDGHSLELHIKAENYLAVLKGKIEIFLEILTPVGWEGVTFVLFEWDGFVFYWIIFEEHKTVDLNQA